MECATDPAVLDSVSNSSTQFLSTRVASSASQKPEDVSLKPIEFILQSISTCTDCGIVSLSHLTVVLQASFLLVSSACTLVGTDVIHDDKLTLIVITSQSAFLAEFMSRDRPRVSRGTLFAGTRNRQQSE